MQCPVCTDTNLLMTDRQGIEIDYCPSCRGVWLDRGELDKIIDRSGVQAAPPQAARNTGSEEHRSHYDPRHAGYHKKKKREGFLGELFDF